MKWTQTPHLYILQEKYTFRPWASIEEVTSSVFIAKYWFNGCGFSPDTSTHKTLENAKSILEKKMRRSGFKLES